LPSLNHGLGLDIQRNFSWFSSITPPAYRDSAFKTELVHFPPPDSKFYRDVDYTERGFLCLSSVPPGECRHST
jgi:hypothetical protein